MSNRLLTKAEFRAWCEEVADKFNADLAAMTPEERQEAIAGLNEWARQIGGFPVENRGKK